MMGDIQVWPMLVQAGGVGKGVSDGVKGGSVTVTLGVKVKVEVVEVGVVGARVRVAV